jgi:SAM-dependent methyltransferase
MLHPFTEKDLLNLLTKCKEVPKPKIVGSKSLEAVRKYANNIKRDMIKKYCKDKIVLDLGSGRGGDLPKYFSDKKNNLQLFAVEPCKNNLDEFKKRLTEYSDEVKKNVKIINTCAQNTGFILQEMTTDKADIVASFLSLSFFFSDDINLDQFLDTVEAALKNNGFFIGLTIDGEATKKLLENKPDKTFNFTGGFMKLNDDDSVIITLEGTIVGENQLEWLVDFKKLTEKLSERNIQIESTEMLLPQPNFSIDENEYISLYRKFTFRKFIDIKEICKNVKMKNCNNEIDRKLLQKTLKYLKETKDLDKDCINAINEWLKCDLI